MEQMLYEKCLLKYLSRKMHSINIFYYFYWKEHIKRRRRKRVRDYQFYLWHNGFEGHVQCSNRYVRLHLKNQEGLLQSKDIGLVIITWKMIFQNIGMDENTEEISVWWQVKIDEENTNRQIKGLGKHICSSVSEVYQSTS